MSAPDALPRPQAASHSTMIDSLSRSPSVLCVAARALRAVPRDAEPTGAVGLGQAPVEPPLLDSLIETQKKILGKKGTVFDSHWKFPFHPRHEILDLPFFLPFFHFKVVYWCTGFTGVLLSNFSNKCSNFSNIFRFFSLLPCFCVLNPCCGSTRVLVRPFSFHVHFRRSSS